MTNDPYGLFSDNTDNEKDPFGLFAGGKDDLKQPILQAGKNFLGGLDAAASMAAGMVPYAISGLAGAGKAITSGSMDEGLKAMEAFQKEHHTTPITPEGKLATEGVGELMNYLKERTGVGIAGVASVLGLGGKTLDEQLNLGQTIGEAGMETVTNFAPVPGGKGVHALGKAIEKRYARPEVEVPKSAADDLLSKKKAAEPTKEDPYGLYPKPTEQTPIDKGLAKMYDQELVQRLDDLNNKINKEDANNTLVDNLKRETAQIKIDKRQEQMEFDVKKQATADFNAAERKRQENASTGYSEDLARRLDDKFARQLRADYSERFTQAQGDAQGPLIVNSFGDAFRGDVQHPDALLADKRQGQALEKEHWVEMRGLKDGEPLRPLQDIGLNEDRAAAADRIAALNRRTRNQGGAIASNAMLADAAAGVKKAFERVVEEMKAVRIHHADAHDALDFMDPHNPQMVNFVRQELKAMGYSPQVEQAFKGLQDAAEHHSIIQDSANMPADIKGKYTFGRTALQHIEKELKLLREQMDALVPGLNQLSGRDYWDKWENYSRGTKAKYRNIAKKMQVLEDRKDALGLTKGQENTLLENQVTSASSADYATEHMNLDAAKEALPNVGTRPNVIPLKQRGAVGDLTPESQKAVQRANMARKFANLGLDEWDTIHDPKVALELSATAKDIGKDYGQKNLISGINNEVALSNNPMLKLARTLFRDARTTADGFSREFITHPENGLSTLWPKMSKEERIGIMDALMQADRHQVELTPEDMKVLKFTDAQTKFAETFRKADEILLKLQNRNARTLGMKEVVRRVGHFPGIFVGAYKALVTRIGEHGKPEVIAVIPSDTKAQLKVAIDYVKKQIPDAKIVEQDRVGLDRSGKAYHSDLLNGWEDVLKLIGREDARFKDVNDIVTQALQQANNRLFNFNVHELSKKGVLGNEGNKPWLNKAKNAQDAFTAMINYFEDGAMHHALQVPMKQINDVMKAPETEHMPNARKYLSQYIDKVHGRDANSIGNALNTLLDAPFALLPTVSWGKNGMKAGVGVGPAIPLKIAGSVKNTMSQIFMGWGNWMFTATQLVQPLQTGLPFLQHISSRIGANPLEVPRAMLKGGTDFWMALAEDVSGKKSAILDDFNRQSFQYAKSRGMFTFSEMEKAKQGTQGTLSRTKDQVAEFNMQLGEQASRTPMFMMVAEMLHHKGAEPKKAFEMAENITQEVMIDYHKWERPMLYSKLGVAGGFAAGLTTFKHGYTSQLTYLAKQGIKPVGGAKRSQAVLPIVAALASMAAFSGITGVPFYQEMDLIYRGVTNMMGEQKSIREALLEKNPEWVNSGVVSAATNLNIQSKFSSADMVPDNVLKAVSPHLEGASKIVGGAYDMLKNQDAQGVRNFATAVAPRGPIQGAVENYLAKDPQGYTIDKQGKRGVYRTEEEWTNRMATGLRSQDEAIDRERTWDARMKQRADTEKRSDIAEEFARRIRNKSMDPMIEKKLTTEYMKRKGDVNELYHLYQKEAEDSWKTEKQRLEGTPSDLRSFYRWQYYNRK